MPIPGAPTAAHSDAIFRAVHQYRTIIGTSSAYLDRNSNEQEHFRNRMNQAASPGHPHLVRLESVQCL